VFPKRLASVIDAIPSNGNCSGFSEFLFRVRALRFLFDPSKHSAAVEMANQAVELDPNDAMNWLVLFQVNPADPRMPINRALELATDLALVQDAYGRYKSDRGEYNEAKQAFQHVLAISPLHFRSMTSLAYLASMEFRPDSVGLYMKAIDTSTIDHRPSTSTYLQRFSIHIFLPARCTWAGEITKKPSSSTKQPSCSMRSTIQHGWSWVERL